MLDNLMENFQVVLDSQQNTVFSIENSAITFTSLLHKLTLINIKYATL